MNQPFSIMRNEKSHTGNSVWLSLNMSGIKLFIRFCCTRVAFVQSCYNFLGDVVG